jgi:hypothetical protein
MGADLWRNYRADSAGDSGCALADRWTGASFCTIQLGGCGRAMDEAEGAAGNGAQSAAEKRQLELRAGAKTLGLDPHKLVKLGRSERLIQEIELA